MELGLQMHALSVISGDVLLLVLGWFCSLASAFEFVSFKKAWRWTPEKRRIAVDQAWCRLCSSDQQTETGFSHRFDYRSLMDPEPGRCRRTDGKKWRCQRNVVPNQKYCERHMHRGCQRSRKHVEASEKNSKSDTISTVNSNNTTRAINSENVDNANTSVSISTPSIPELMLHSSNTSSNAPATLSINITFFVSGDDRGFNNAAINSGSPTPPTIDVNSCTGNKESGNNYLVKKETTDVVATASTYTTTATCPAFTNATFDCPSNSRSDNYRAGFGHINDRNTINKSSGDGKNGNFGSFLAPGFGFSRGSVLEDATGVGRSSVGQKYKTIIGADLQRCRRTDGKKWQCSREVVPGQKYCGQHMHRGAKKLAVDVESVTLAAAPPPLAIPKYVDYTKSLNTSLSISTTASHQEMTHDENNSTSSSSSDATTITDENASVSHLLALSP